MPTLRVNGYDLAFVEHEGLRMEDAPTGEDMTVDADERGLSAWIDACLPNPLSGLQAHHVGGRQGQASANPAQRQQGCDLEGTERLFTIDTG